jgi:hypothetical protein
MRNLYQVFVRLFDKDLVLQNLYALIYKLSLKKKLSIFDNLQAVVALVLVSSKKLKLEA